MVMLIVGHSVLQNIVSLSISTLTYIHARTKEIQVTDSKHLMNYKLKVFKDVSSRVTMNGFSIKNDISWLTDLMFVM